MRGVSSNTQICISSDGLKGSSCVCFGGVGCLDTPAFQPPSVFAVVSEEEVLVSSRRVLSQ